MNLILFTLLFPCLLFGQIVPRKILALWDSKSDGIEEASFVHTHLEMPLNYLGFDILYHDIQKPLPSISNNESIAAIIIAFQQCIKVKNPDQVILWAINNVEKGKKVILMENHCFTAPLDTKPVSQDLINKLYEIIGCINSQNLIDKTYDYHVVEQSNELFPFEAKIPNPYPGFYETCVNKGRAQSFLRIQSSKNPSSSSDLIVISKYGACVAPQYAINKGWIFDPIIFFEKVLVQEPFPIPDTTTLNGLRIAYSTCLGSNFNSGSKIEAYKNKDWSCGRILNEEIFKAHPEIPTTLAIIAADVDPTWNGTVASQNSLMEISKLPHMEIACHTYSHPFDWQFFRWGGKELETDFLHLYPYGTWQNSFLSWFKAQSYAKIKDSSPLVLKEGYLIPRAYAKEPFDLMKEVVGSTQYLQNQLNAKQIEGLVWSGNALPWDVPSILCKKAGLYSFGGGFVRLDSNYPSLIYVYPLGRRSANIPQIYASSNSDNNYTSGWTDQFYGYQNVISTWQNTESPRRLKPLQLNYHGYSAEFEASLNALKKNIQFINSTPHVSIKTSDYCAIANGFYTTQIEKIGHKKWKIKNRGALQTVRFDHLQNESIDFNNSQGILGFKKVNNTLYVTLNPKVETPILSLSSKEEEQIYLSECNYSIHDVMNDHHKLFFVLHGYGPLIISFKVAQNKTYPVTINGESFEITAQGNYLKIQYPQASESVSLEVSLT